jgi:hypothetical protein
VALAHPGSSLVIRRRRLQAGLLVRLADGLDYRPELVYRLPGVQQLALGPGLALHPPVKLDDLVGRPFLMRLLEALLVSLAGETLFDIHGGEDLFALCAYVSGMTACRINYQKMCSSVKTLARRPDHRSWPH